MSNNNMSTCDTDFKMAKHEEVHKALKLLSSFLQPALPFINSHLNSFFTESCWDCHLPLRLQEDLNAVTVPELINYFRTLASIKHELVDKKDKNKSTVFDSKVSFTESSLKDVIGRVGQLFLCSMNMSCGVDLFDLSSCVRADANADDELSEEKDDDFALSTDDGTGRSCKNISTSADDDSGWSSWKFDPFMSPKKMHEVQLMSELVLKVTDFQNARTEQTFSSCQSSLEAERQRTEYLIDLGSGKGYLSSVLVLLFNYRVLAIDSSSVNTYGCTKRTATLEKNWSSFIRRVQEKQTATASYRKIKRGKHWKSKVPNPDNHQVLHISNAETSNDNDRNAENANETATSNSPDLVAVSVSSSNRNAANDSDACEKLKNVTLHVAGSLNLLQLLKHNFFSYPVDADADTGAEAEHSIDYGVVGLHTCGQLGVDSVKLFCNSDQAKFLVNVPCCYHLLNELWSYELGQAGAGVVGNDKDKTSDICGFPLSKILQAMQFTIGRNARMMSSQSLHRMSSDESNLNISRPLLFRALLSVIIKKKLGPISLDHHVGRIGGKFSDFRQYVRKALTKLNLKDLQVSDNEIDQVYRKYEPLSERFHKYFLLRAMFAPLIEACILLDRLAYLLEQDHVRDAFIVQLFNPFLSPRCNAIVALR